MNVRLQYPIEFTAGFYFDNMLWMNNYQVRLWMMTTTPDPENNNIAFERIKFFVNEVLDSGVFISKDNEEQCKLLLAAGVKIITLPDEPVDQIVGIMLYCKLNAICEDQMIIGEVEISSTHGGDVVYIHSNDEPVGPYEQDGWWNKSNLIHYHHTITETENIMSLSSATTWRDLSLQWTEDIISEPDSETPESDDTGNTIVFVNFKKDETK